jgi:DNA repair exonuclease SbcCD ATPase subunit
MTSTDQMLKDLGTVFNFLRFKPQKPIFHPYALKDMEHLQQTNTILDTLNPLITTLHQRTKLKPQLPDINPELSKLETLAQPLNSLKDLITTHRKKPKHPQTTLQDLDADLDYQHQTAQALNNLTALKQYTSNKPSLPVSTQDFTPLVKTCEQLNQTLNTLDTLKTTLNQIPNQTKLPNNLNPLLNALQSLQTLQDALTHRPRVPILKDFTDMDLQMEQHLQDLKQQLHSTLNNLTRKPSKPTNVTDLTIPLRTLTTLQATLPLVNKLVEHVPKTNMKRHELEELTQALAKYQCPTCGSFYLGGNKV